MPLLRLGRGAVRVEPLHLYAVRADGLGLSIDRALCDIVDHRSKVIRFDLHEDISERGPCREIHHPDERGLLAQAHGRAVSMPTREKLAASRIADPLIPNPLTQAFQALGRPGQSVFLGFDSQVRKDISERRAHGFLGFCGPTRCLDANSQHAVPIRRTAFNFLDRSRESDEGILWTCAPWGPGCARSS
jgi:hypothetical protein